MGEEKRKSIRFFPEVNEIAVISRDKKYFDKYDFQKYQFKGELCAIISEEAHKGCSIVMAIQPSTGNPFAEGDKCVIQIGDLMPVRAEIVWNKKLDDNIYKTGIQFLD